METGRSCCRAWLARAKLGGPAVPARHFRLHIVVWYYDPRPRWETPASTSRCSANRALIQAMAARRDRRMIRGFACDAAASTCRIDFTPGRALTLTFARR